MMSISRMPQSRLTFNYFSTSKSFVPRPLGPGPGIHPSGVGIHCRIGTNEIQDCIIRETCIREKDVDPPGQPETLWRRKKAQGCFKQFKPAMRTFAKWQGNTWKRGSLGMSMTKKAFPRTFKVSYMILLELKDFLHKNKKLAEIYKGPGSLRIIQQPSRHFMRWKSTIKTRKCSNYIILKKNKRN